MFTRMIKLIRTMLLLIFLSSVISKTEAAQSDSITVRVTVSPSISISISEDALLLGSVAAGSATVSASAITVTNNGSGVNETYSLSLVNPSGWTASQTTNGQETYVLNAAFDADGAGITWDEDKHALSTTATACSASKFAGDQTAVAVPYNATRKLWFQFKAPTATAVNTEQGMVVTVTAGAS